MAIVLVIVIAIDWAFKYPGRKKYKLLFHNGSVKKKVLQYGTPKPSYRVWTASGPGGWSFGI